MTLSRVMFFAAAALCVAVVTALPIEQIEGLVPASQDLDRLMMVEADNEEALRSKRTIGILRQLFPEASKDVNNEAENLVGAGSENNEVRVQFDDQSGAAANGAVAPELAPLDDIEVTNDNRDKRFLNFGLGGSASSSGGSGGGSGNFLFDIIRQTADGAARAAGTVYRVVAGTQSLGLGLSASRDVAPAAAPATPPVAPGAPAATPANGSAPPPPTGNGTAGPGLVAGSGGTEQGDAAANAPTDPGRAVDGTQEAVPGPITRLFVIANRGISNLVQDLILRLAATSERIVNFKARLITSII